MHNIGAYGFGVSIDECIDTWPSRIATQSLGKGEAMQSIGYQSLTKYGIAISTTPMPTIAHVLLTT